MSSFFFDYNSTTPVDPEALQAMLPYFSDIFANPSGQTSDMSWKAQSAIKQSKSQISELLGCKPQEIIFTSGATESINWALDSFIKSKKQILLSEIEHDACFQKAREYELSLFFKSNPDGSVDLDSLKKQAKSMPTGSLVNFIWGHNELGTVLELEPCIEIAKNAGHFVHLDATQVLGKITIDFKSLNADFLSCSAHKVYGPKGIGALVINSTTVTGMKPLIAGGGQQNGLRSGTLNSPLIVGFGKACEVAKERLTTDQNQFRELRKFFLNEIKDLNFKLNGLQSNCLLNTVNLSLKDWKSPSPLYLELMPFSVSQSSACSTESDKKRILSSLGIPGSCTLRISFGRSTTTENCKALADKIKSVLKSQSD